MTPSTAAPKRPRKRQAAGKPGKGRGPTSASGGRKKRANGKKTYYLRLRIRGLRSKGKKSREICEILEISSSELRRLEAHKPKPRADQLNGKAWCEFLANLTVENENEAREVAGRPLEDTQARAYFRWMVEGVVPTIFSADRFLVAIDMHIDDYFEFCEERGAPAWAEGKEPDWHRKAA